MMNISILRRHHFLIYFLLLVMFYFCIKRLIREDKVLIQGDGVLIQDDGVSILIDRGPIQEDRGLIQEDRGLIQEDRDLVKKDGISVQEDRGPVQKDVISVPEDRGPVKKDGISVQEDRGPVQPHEKRSFVVDYENNCFRKDGKPFQYVSGSIHYYRIPHELWADRLYKVKMAGVKVISTYIQWRYHEPEPGEFKIDKSHDFIKFIKLAASCGLLVNLRPGPYNCGEQDMGGLPYWLLRVKPDIHLRSSDETFIKYLDRWFNYFLPMIRPLLYNNGGPVIMVQVENEYGWGAGGVKYHDSNYMTHLRELIKRNLKTDVVLYTADSAFHSTVQLGHVNQTLVTINFRTGVSLRFKTRLIRKYMKKGPLVNSEYYTGWMDHWGQVHETIGSKVFAQTLEELLRLNYSINIYMFHGGTSFGFNSGCNLKRFLEPCLTSYDYDAPISEAGDLTKKYFATRKVIGKFWPLPPGPLPRSEPKLNFGPVFLTKRLPLFTYFSSCRLKRIESKVPLSFEDLYHPYGLVLYETNITFQPTSPVQLKVENIADRGYIYVDQEFQGILSRERKKDDQFIKIQKGQTLSILVENQGRIYFGPKINDRKGIFRKVTLGGERLFNWRMTPMNLEEDFVQGIDYLPIWKDVKGSGSGFYQGYFQINNNSIKDTFIRFDGWHKGGVFINGFNLGRYWPIVGPQLTLYLPKTHLKAAPLRNVITVFELEHSPCASLSKCHVSLVNKHVLNGRYHPEPKTRNQKW